MSRFILRYKEGDPIPASARQRLLQTPNLKLVDESARMILVEGTSSAVKTLLTDRDWSATPETEIKVPDTRPKPRVRPA